MLNASRPLQRTMLTSPLDNQSRLKASSAHSKRTMVAGLMLTSLVDAFSILVIFLIMNHSANQEALNVGDKIQLPQARESQFIQEGVVVRVEGGQYLVDEKPIALPSLAAHLKTLNDGAEKAKKEGLIIVADRQMDYADLSPVILAGSNAGFTKFKFAVIRNE